ncbi:Dihydrolipoyllysine-residue acetyltransferase component of pyruvate dehydrogenase complex [Sarcoptes scabiei]|nr:Dihydrolipoyllysine-residue acetyltransferase component of pyruvate dehydrogenase complex [Sarcoptes scabiei]
MNLKESSPYQNGTVQIEKLVSKLKRKSIDNYHNPTSLLNQNGKENNSLNLREIQAMKQMKRNHLNSSHHYQNQQLHPDSVLINNQQRDFVGDDGGGGNNTVVINLDEMNLDDSSANTVYFNSLENNNGYVTGENPNKYSKSMLMANGIRRKKRDLSSPSSMNGSYQTHTNKMLCVRENNGNDYHHNDVQDHRDGSANNMNLNGNHRHLHHQQRNKNINGCSVNNSNNNTSVYDSVENAEDYLAIDASSDADLYNDDINDLLMSALISQGIELDFVQNSYFQKFINTLVKYSSTVQPNSYRLPDVDRFTTCYVNSLVEKFDYETAKLFFECDSIVIAFDSVVQNRENPLVISNTDSKLKSSSPLSSVYVPNNGRRLNVNLLISIANSTLSLYYKTIICSSPQSASNTPSIKSETMEEVNKDDDVAEDEAIASSSDEKEKSVKEEPESSGKIKSDTSLEQKFQSKKKSSLNGNVNDADDENSVYLKFLNNQIDSLINKLGPDQVNAVILPYKDPQTSNLITSYLSACHSHIVPLTNSFLQFNELLCDICCTPTISSLIKQSIDLFKELETNLFDFQQENQKLWRQVFEADKLKIFNFLDSQTQQKPHQNDDGEMNGVGSPQSLPSSFSSSSSSSIFLNSITSSSSSSTSPQSDWISLYLMFSWFSVASDCISKLFTFADDDDTCLQKILNKFNLQSETDLKKFFDSISIVFNFLTPFIKAIYSIENESVVISDIIKIYFDLKSTISESKFFNGIGDLCGKLERQTIDSIIHDHLQEQNFSRYYFLAYYLDPRFRDDYQIESNEELTAQVYDALFNYANTLGCVNNDDEDREKLMVSLEEFRNGDKLYGMQLLKCPKSPSKFWKHLRRFPGTSKLSYCASRLLSISARSMLLRTPSMDHSTKWLQEKVLKKLSTDDTIGTDRTTILEKILPIKSYLQSQLSFQNGSGSFLAIDDVIGGCGEVIVEQHPSSTMNWSVKNIVKENGGGNNQSQQPQNLNTMHNQCDGQFTSADIFSIVNNVVRSLNHFQHHIIAQSSTSMASSTFAIEDQSTSSS